jgi:hypothetical protein
MAVRSDASCYIHARSDEQRSTDRSRPVTEWPPGWAWAGRAQAKVADRPVAAGREWHVAVDLRDTLAEAGSGDTSRAVFLLDVLNHLADLQGIDTAALWERL